MLLVILFWVLFAGIFGRLAVFSFKFSWAILRVLFVLVFLPLAFVGLFCWGLIKIALPVLVIVGLISLFAKRA